ncbi:hypothetical protein N402_05825 [Helicobacter pylori FD423]|nr:hypothetical protein N402_05825 [Helicobacter pylori FD423]
MQEIIQDLFKCLILKMPLSVFKQAPFKEGFSKQTHN